MSKSKFDVLREVVDRVDFLTDVEKKELLETIDEFEREVADNV